MWTLNLEEKHLKLLRLNLQIIIIIGHSTYNFILFLINGHSTYRWTLNLQLNPVLRHARECAP